MNMQACAIHTTPSIVKNDVIGKRRFLEKNDEKKKIMHARASLSDEVDRRRCNALQLLLFFCLRAATRPLNSH